MQRLDDDWGRQLNELILKIFMELKPETLLRGSKMATIPSAEKSARKVLEFFVNQRPGDFLTFRLIQHKWTWHHDDLVSGLRYAFDQGWLRQGDGDNIFLTQKGFKEAPEKEEAVKTPLTITDIHEGLSKFRKDFPDGNRSAFIMMPFDDTEIHRKILQVIKETLHEFDITGLRADDRSYMDDLFHNIKVYMTACTFGVAIFERVTDKSYNPNVSLEVGYMLGSSKHVLFLKDKTLERLPTDLASKLYCDFDINHISETLPPAIIKWLNDKGFIEKK